MSEEITGVCVDIPTLIKDLKQDRAEYNAKLSNATCPHFMFKGELDSEGFAICSKCKERYSLKAKHYL